MAGKEKNFNVKAYSVASVICVAILLVVICIVTFASRYTAFHPDELARVYVESIVQAGDGYNAYKNTLVSKKMKYGDFIRKNYLDQIIYRDVDSYYPGDSTDGLTGYNDESFKGEKTLSDDGTLAGQLTEKMYPVYEDLIISFGWDEYHKIFKAYTEKLIIVREEIFGDKYMTDEIFFTAFEANVAAYGKKLTGTEDIFDENTGVQLSHKSAGIYEEVYGTDYKFVTEAVAVADKDINEYKSNIDTELFDVYGVNADDISDVKTVTVKVSLADGTQLSSSEVTVVKIGMGWYVDNTNTDTSALYEFYS